MDSLLWLALVIQVFSASQRANCKQKELLGLIGKLKWEDSFNHKAERARRTENLNTHGWLRAHPVAGNNAAVERVLEAVMCAANIPLLI